MANCCPSCYHLCDPVPDCLETLSLQTLIESDLITVKIIDKFDNTYLVHGATDAMGVIDIDLVELPETLLNRYAGAFKIKVENNGVIVPFVVDETNYDCISFEIGNVEGQIDDNYLIDVYGIARNNDYY